MSEDTVDDGPTKEEAISEREELMEESTLPVLSEEVKEEIPPPVITFNKGDSMPPGAIEYRKHATTMLVKMPTDFRCETNNSDIVYGKAGDYMAPDSNGGFYPVSAEMLAANYEPATKGTNAKTLHNSDISGAKKNVKDIRVVGNGDLFKLLSKASSEGEGWMKSTKAMVTPHGCVIQVTTQQRNIDGTYAVAEALTYVPGVKISSGTDGAKLVKN